MYLIYQYTFYISYICKDLSGPAVLGSLHRLRAVVCAQVSAAEKDSHRKQNAGTAQGRLANKKTRNPLGPPEDPRPTVGS